MQNTCPSSNNVQEVVEIDIFMLILPILQRYLNTEGIRAK